METKLISVQLRPFILVFIMSACLGFATRVPAQSSDKSPTNAPVVVIKKTKAWKKLLKPKTVISAYIYYEEDRVLELFFKGKQARSYKKVDKETWHSFKTSKDKGAFYRKNILFNYSYK